MYRLLKKLSLIVLVSTFIGFGGCHSARQDNDTMSEQSQTCVSDRDIPRIPYSSPLFDQYFEILRSLDSDGQILDTIPGMVNLFLMQYWVIPADSVKFKMKLGLSLDKNYPNVLVRKTVFEYLNKYLACGFEYDITSDKQKDLISKGADSSVDLDSFLKEWKCISQKVSSLNGYDEKCSNLSEIAGSGSCTVCHKIYEDSENVTYLIEGGSDYHSSSGDLTKADYITINKSTGRILSVTDIRRKYDESILEKLISDAYKLAVEANGLVPAEYSGIDLLEEVDGVAIINEGLLFYYHPYKIGVGSEGQYCLILSEIETNALTPRKAS